MAARIAEVQGLSLPWLVAELEAKVVGYAYAGKWKVRSAYRCAQGMHVAIGGATLPNDASVASHDLQELTSEVVMNSNRHGLAAQVPVMALCMGGAYASAQSSDSQGVSQSLTSTKASPKVGTVLWTRRSDHYTLQVVFPRSTSICIRPNTAVTVWLLGADGATIPVSRHAPSSCSEDLYSVSLPSAQSAVAIAIKIDDDYFIEKLKTLD